MPSEPTQTQHDGLVAFEACCCLAAISTQHCDDPFQEIVSDVRKIQFGGNLQSLHRTLTPVPDYPFALLRHLFDTLCRTLDLMYCKP
jgi:hypothetical protein